MLKNTLNLFQFCQIVTQYLKFTIVFVDFSHDGIFKLYIQGNVVLNLFFGMFAGSLPISHGYFSP